MQVNQSLSPQHWGVTNPSHINQLLVTPPLLTFYVGKISACLTCSPCCTSRKIKCLDAKYGTKAFLLVNLEVQSRGWGGRGGGALARVQSGQEKLHCWTQTILLTECCNMVARFPNWHEWRLGNQYNHKECGLDSWVNVWGRYFVCVCDEALKWLFYVYKITNYRELPPSIIGTLQQKYPTSTIIIIPLRKSRWRTLNAPTVATAAT